MFYKATVILRNKTEYGSFFTYFLRLGDSGFYIENAIIFLHKKLTEKSEEKSDEKKIVGIIIECCMSV